MNYTTATSSKTTSTQSDQSFPNGLPRQKLTWLSLQAAPGLPVETALLRRLSHCLIRTLRGLESYFGKFPMTEIGTSTIQSRAVGGLANGTLIFSLPGSSGRRNHWVAQKSWSIS